MIFDESSATVALAAQAVGVEEARILKTLSFRKKDGTVLLVCCAGDGKVENKLFKAEFGFKAKMLSAAEVEEETGYAVGGVCPFVSSERVEITLDRSLQRFDAIYPAGGDAHSAVKLTCDELEAVTGGRWVEVCSIAQ